MAEERQLITGLFPSSSPKGPTLKVNMSADVIDRFQHAFDELGPGSELVIWPARQPREGGPTHHLFIGPRAAPANRTEPQGGPGSPGAHERDSGVRGRARGIDDSF